MSAPAGRIPRWVDVALIPLINIALAFLVSGVILWFIGVDPVFAVEVILYGAFGYDLAIGYTLYYTPHFVFTGLAVAVAFHAGLFNIGGAGQAYIGGLGAAPGILAVDPLLPFYLILPRSEERRVGKRVSVRVNSGGR